MGQTITAVYEKGTFILNEPLSISDGSEVEILVVSKKVQNGQSVAERLSKIAALPLEGKTDKFSGRDHDRILYGRKESDK